MKPHAFDYERGQSVNRVCEQLANGSSRLIAGGQSLGPMLTLRLAQPEALLDVATLPELRGYQLLDDGLVIGAAITHAEIEDGLLPDACNGILPRIAQNIAYRAVRSKGTIGGSLAHADPAADWASSLCALGAQVILQRHDNGDARYRRMRLTDFLRGAFQTALMPDELLLAVYLPRVPPESRFGYFKLCRKTGELAHAIGVIYVDAATGIQRAVLGALAGNPITLEGEDALSSEAWGRALDKYSPDMDSGERAMRLNVLQRALDRSNQQ